MHLITEATALKKALVSVQALIPEEHQVVLRADSSQSILIIEAGENGIYLKQKLPSTVMQDGELVINSSYITALHLKDKITLKSTSQNTMDFTCGQLTGTLETHQSKQRIVDQRPTEDITIQIQLAKEIVTRAINKTTFSSNISTQEGLRIKIDNFITTSTTDQFRLAYFKDQLPFHKADIDLMIKQNILSLAISKIEEPEVWIGFQKGVIKVASPSFEFYHPTIQQEPTDVEGWVNSIDPAEKICEIKVKVQDILQTLTSVTSITGSSNADTRVNCTISENKFIVETTASHGSAKANMTLEEVVPVNHKVILNSKYTTEMLSLNKDSVVTLAFYEPYVIIFSNDQKSISVVPTCQS